MTADGTQILASDQQVLDDETLPHLLALAGPREAPELMRRLNADLHGVVAGLTAGVAALDRDAMRGHSHVLMAIAGTIGAAPVYHLAQQLNQCAKDETCTSAKALVQDLMRWLSGLIDCLQDLSAELGMDD